MSQTRMPKNKVKLDKALGSILEEISEYAKENNRKIIIPKLPSNDSIDIDILVSDRQKINPVGFLKEVRVPLKTYRNSLFAYVLNDNQKILPLDFSTVKWLNDKSINRLAEHTNKSGIDDILLLDEEAKAAFQLLKNVRSRRFKKNDFMEIREALLKSEEKTINIIKDLCDSQNYSSEAVVNFAKSIRLRVPSEDGFMEMLDIDIFSPSDTFLKTWKSLGEKISNKIKVRKYLRNNTTNRPMPVIAFVGIDGSGKSTAIDRFILRNRKIKPHIITLRGKDPGYRITVVVRNVLKRLISLSNKLGLAYLKYLITLLDDAIDFLDRYLRAKAALASAKKEGLPVFSDRWAIDKACNVTNGLRGRLIKFLFVRWFPKPDKIIFFDIDGTTSYKRKKEYDIDTQNEKRKTLINLLRYYKQLGCLTTIDGTLSFAEIDRILSQDFYNTMCFVQGLLPHNDVLYTSINDVRVVKDFMEIVGVSYIKRALINNRFGKYFTLTRSGSLFLTRNRCLLYIDKKINLFRRVF